ncbi:MAG: tetratricopeptide (TPR) repeat protein [Gammaproteobacteria bacterium]|jgi:tetratricopeptide (TPR) repeat protein
MALFNRSWFYLFIHLILIFWMFSSAHADQRDQRLDELFDQLASPDDAVKRQEAENGIWKIWFESGSTEVDELMATALEAADRGKLKAAEQLYNSVIDLAPDFAEAWNRRATIRYYQSDFEGSLEDIRQTLILEPRHYGAVWGLGMILGLRHEFEKSIAAFEQLLRIKPYASGIQDRIELLKLEMSKNSV